MWRAGPDPGERKRFALASHFSVLVFDILGLGGAPDERPQRRDDDPLIVRNLHDTLDGISEANLQEAWNDAIKFKEDALSAFRLGYLRLPERARAEQLAWACARRIVELLPTDDNSPDELRSLRASLASTYYGNFSVFRSAPDTWAIDQLFPVMPIHRLHEQPEQLGSIADLTCDSDGKLARFIQGGQSKSLLELHTPGPGTALPRRPVPGRRLPRGDGQPAQPVWQHQCGAHPPGTRWWLSTGTRGAG